VTFDTHAYLFLVFFGYGPRRVIVISRLRPFRVLRTSAVRRRDSSIEIKIRKTSRNLNRGREDSALTSSRDYFFSSTNAHYVNTTSSMVSGPVVVRSRRQIIWRVISRLIFNRTVTILSNFGYASHVDTTTTTNNEKIFTSPVTRTPKTRIYIY